MIFRAEYMVESAKKFGSTHKDKPLDEVKSILEELENQSKAPENTNALVLQRVTLNEVVVDLVKDAKKQVYKSILKILYPYPQNLVRLLFAAIRAKLFVVFQLSGLGLRHFWLRRLVAFLTPEYNDHLIELTTTNFPAHVSNWIDEIRRIERKWEKN